MANKRILITLPMSVIELLEKSSEQTNLTKSQLIMICLRRGLKDVVNEYENPTSEQQ